MDATIETLDAQPILGIRVTVKMADIGLMISELMPELMVVVRDRAAGAPVARWHSWEADQGEMELAVPLAAAAEGEGRVAPAELPGGRAVVAWHIGSYESLAATWTELTEWMERMGHVGRSEPWEQYESDCTTTEPDKLRTRIVWPIE